MGHKFTINVLSCSISIHFISLANSFLHINILLFLFSVAEFLLISYQYFSHQSPISNFLLLRRGSFFRQCTVLLCSQLFCREYLSDFYFRLAQIKEFVFLLHFLNEFEILSKKSFVLWFKDATQSSNLLHRHFFQMSLYSNTACWSWCKARYSTGQSLEIH